MHLVELYASALVGLVQYEKNVVWFARFEVLRWFNFGILNLLCLICITFVKRIRSYSHGICAMKVLIIIIIIIIIIHWFAL